MFEPFKESAGSQTLYLSIIFKNCRHFRGSYRGNVMNLLFENCTINELRGSDTDKLLGSTNSVIVNLNIFLQQRLSRFY